SVIFYVAAGSSSTASDPPSLHDALPIWVRDVAVVGVPDGPRGERVVAALVLEPGASVDLAAVRRWAEDRISAYAMPRAVTVLERSEEHTSELQSRENLVCRLLLEKKNDK